jgi:hypothetical protein
MSDGINRWLEGIGLGEYAATFAENAIDEDVLPDPTLIWRKSGSSSVIERSSSKR